MAKKKTLVTTGRTRERALKIRLHDAEFDELDKASKDLSMMKAQIVREAVKEYLSKRDIEIWNY